MNAVRASVSRHTDMLMISQSSPRTGTSVALPESDWSRQTKPCGGVGGGVHGVEGGDEVRQLRGIQRESEAAEVGLGELVRG